MIQYVPATPTSRRQATNRVSGLRVLTSSEGLAILKEKEDKKKQELEEKKRRKEEREQKKKEKEELMKKKAENKNKTTKKRKATTRSSCSKRQKSHNSNAVEPSQSAVTSDTHIDDSVCCECGQSYEDDARQGSGAEWVQCSCSRWLHEECINEVDLDTCGNEVLCSFCLIEVN